MKKSKLVTIFEILDPLERRELEKMLHSPFYNHRTDVQVLFYFLKKNAEKEQPIYQKSEAFKAVYPKEKYDDVKMRHCMSFLFKMIETYLIEKITDKSKIAQKLRLASAYRVRNLDKFFLQTLESARRALEQLPQDWQYYHFNHQIESEHYAYIHTKKRTASYNLQALADAYDIQFLANKLKQSCLQLSHQAVFRVDYDAGLLPMVLQFLEKSAYLDIPAIAIFYYCYKALTEESEADFQKLKSQLLEYQHLFPKRDMRDVLLLAINFCIKQLNTGKEIYVREAFDLYQLGLTNELLLEQNQISRFAYKNAVALGLRLGEFDWIESFIVQYAPFLDSRYRQNYFTYNRARLAFFKKEYVQAMSLLIHVDSEDLLMTIDAKVMLLKMYYELEEFDALDTLLASFRTYLNRKKVLGYHQENYLKVIDFTKKLLYMNGNDRVEVQTLQKEIEESGVLEKEWLLEQLG